MRAASLRCIGFSGFFGLLCAAAACGGDDASKADAAPPPDIGFNKPTAALKANDNAAEVGAADLACLGTAAGDSPTTVVVTLSTTVKDFQQGTAVGSAKSAKVIAFRGTDVGQPFDTQSPDADGKVALTIPVGVARFGFKMSAQGWLDTLLLNQKVDPGMAAQTLSEIQIVSSSTGDALPALIFKERTLGTGVLAGAVRDCKGRELSNFIATVSSTRGTATPLDGADTYYFDPMINLPVRHTQRGAASANGLFMVIQLPVAPAAYVQVWGYPTEADVAADQLKLIAELAAPVIADTVITGTYEPLRQ
jgi:hypothetical protein